MPDTEYDTFYKLPLDQLARKTAGSGIGSSLDMAKIVYQQRMIDIQHEYAKKQINLQHTNNLILLKKQLRWIKFSAILNAIVIIAAVVLGFLLQELKSYIIPKSSTQQSIQVHPEASIKTIPAPRQERKNDKVSSQPPIKGKKYK